MEIIIKQLERTFNGLAWHGPSIMEVLNKVNLEHASQFFQKQSYDS
jgi:hypothetical protein